MVTKLSLNNCTINCSQSRTNFTCTTVQSNRATTLNSVASIIWTDDRGCYHFHRRHQSQDPIQKVHTCSSTGIVDRRGENSAHDIQPRAVPHQTASETFPTPIAAVEHTDQSIAYNCEKQQNSNHRAGKKCAETSTVGIPSRKIRHE